MVKKRKRISIQAANAERDEAVALQTQVNKEICETNDRLDRDTKHLKVLRQQLYVANKKASDATEFAQQLQDDDDNQMCREFVSYVGLPELIQIVGSFAIGLETASDAIQRSASLCKSRRRVATEQEFVAGLKWAIQNRFVALALVKEHLVNYWLDFVESGASRLLQVFKTEFKIDDPSMTSKITAVQYCMELKRWKTLSVLVVHYGITSTLTHEAFRQLPVLQRSRISPPSFEFWDNIGK